ncbi:MAG: HAMP domain-containing sensor histidine kinase [Xenococcaceae cyanobacterium MO_188.B29]|nr:HAMP domain-containing sensor histidine kinase [Xenococcaceae cyanobacterium MO_188.B29]
MSKLSRLLQNRVLQHNVSDSINLEFMMSEIDDLKKELKETKLAYQMAAQMSQFKASFLARTSHELRSPLSSLIGLHQLILSDLCESPEEQKEFIAQAYQSALKLMKLIDEIVTVSKTEHGTNKLILESIPIEDLFNYIHHLTHLQAANRNLKLNIISPEEQLYVYADHTRLVQSIVHLIDSAISIMRDGTIQVTADALSESDMNRIIIKLDCSPEIWQEGINSSQEIAKIDLEQIKEFSQDIKLSPGMKLLLSRTLLETMGGSLEISDILVEDTQTSQTQLILNCQRPS